MLLGKVPFLHMLFLENEEQPGREKKIQCNVSQEKRSPHAKIQLFLSTFKNGEKSRAHSCIPYVGIHHHVLRLSPD